MVRTDLDSSLEMLYYAANRVEILPVSRFYDYSGTWVYAEDITYISERLCLQ